jgi:hypothetical protein
LLAADRSANAAGDWLDRLRFTQNSDYDPDFKRDGDNNTNRLAPRAAWR